MSAVGSYLYGVGLRKLKLSELWWYYDELSEFWVVKNGEWGLMQAYITREMVEHTIFTPESVLSNWIWRVCHACLDGPADSEPFLVPLAQK